MENVIEIWKPVVGLEAYYMVSSLGRVKSLDRWRNAKNGSKSLLKGKIMKEHYIDNGYIRVLLNDGITKKKYLVHRLVAEAFIPNPDNLPIINHRDENKQNNCVNNLEWCDIKYNTRYSLATPIIQFTLDGELVKKWDTTIDIEQELGINHSAVSACCKNKYGYKTAGGFKWKYYDKETYLIGIMNNNIKKGAA